MPFENAPLGGGEMDDHIVAGDLLGGQEATTATSSTTTAIPTHGVSINAASPPAPSTKHDLFGGVSDRTDRVAAEDRQRQPLRQQRLAEPRAGPRPPHHQALAHIPEPDRPAPPQHRS